MFPENNVHALQDIRVTVNKEVNAAIQGAFEGGTTEVIVNENHSGKEIIPELLDKRAVLLYGKPKFLMTAEGIESCDTLFLPGIHPRAGCKDGVTDHTWNLKEIFELRVNGKPIGEIGLNALLAAHYGVPVSLVTGDKAACDEALDLLGDVETVAINKVQVDLQHTAPTRKSIMRKSDVLQEKPLKNTTDLSL